MRTCAIDIHHHYFPPGVLEEGKRHGSALGEETRQRSRGGGWRNERRTQHCFHWRRGQIRHSTQPVKSRAQTLNDG